MRVCCGWVQTVLLRCFIQFFDVLQSYGIWRSYKKCVINLMSVIKAECDKVFWTSKFHGMFTKRQFNCLLIVPINRQFSSRHNNFMQQLFFWAHLCPNDTNIYIYIHPYIAYKDDDNILEQLIWHHIATNWDKNAQQTINNIIRITSSRCRCLKLTVN